MDFPSALLPTNGPLQVFIFILQIELSFDAVLFWILFPDANPKSDQENTRTQNSSFPQLLYSHVEEI